MYVIVDYLDKGLPCVNEVRGLMEGGGVPRGYGWIGARVTLAMFSMFCVRWSVVLVFYSRVVSVRQPVSSLRIIRVIYLTTAIGAHALKCQFHTQITAFAQLR